MRYREKKMDNFIKCHENQKFASVNEVQILISQYIQNAEKRMTEKLQSLMKDVEQLVKPFVKMQNLKEILVQKVNVKEFKRKFNDVNRIIDIFQSDIMDKFHSFKKIMQTSLSAKVNLQILKR
jgi:hypothetical protein